MAAGDGKNWPRPIVRGSPDKWTLLRNGLAVLSSTTWPGVLGASSAVDETGCSNAGRTPTVPSRVVKHLTRLVDLLTSWLLSPACDKDMFLQP